MGNAYLVMLVVLCLSLVGPCFAADSALAEWSFSKASDAQGWTSAGGTIGVNDADGALTISGTECRLISPLFDIKATPWQFVEIEMKTDKSADAILFYSNTTEEPYGGFRGGLQTSFRVAGDGQYHTYTVLPWWQSQGKIIHIRIDPPGGNSAVKAVRVIGWEPDKAGATNWKFANTNAGWRAFGLSGQPAVASCWSILGSREGVVLSPAIDVAATDAPWLNLRVLSRSAHTLLFRWICADRDGLQSLPIEVKGDGEVHNYNVDLSKVGGWSGRILGVGLTPTDSTDPSRVSIESVALARAPGGPAEIKITSLGLADPFTRAGSKARIVLEFTNTGGADAQFITATLTLTIGGKPKKLTMQVAKSLAPGKTVHFEWEETFGSAGTVLAAANAGAKFAPTDQKQAQLRIYPKLDKAAVKGLKYVPEPKAADTGKYLVGCYNFPGWRDYGAWSVLNDYPERKPILGYYHDGNPEVADWQINWALEHGIKFLIYDWYWSRGGRHLEEGLNDGFLKSKYQDKMKFCLLWANHNGPGSHSEADMMNVTKYWIDNYFKRPNYLKLGGKNVVVIFNPNGITGDMGQDGAKAAFAKMNKLCEDSGVGGLYLIACAGPSKDQIATIAAEGYGAISGYNYPGAGDRGQNVAPYSWMVDAYKDIWNQIDNMSSIPYIPLCEAGWDSRPWHGPGARVRTGKSAELWQKMLSNAKAYDDDPGHKLPDGKKLVFIEAWNEYGEGDYIEPTAGDGFSYLEAVRNVFAPKSKQPTIITPKDIGMGPYELPVPVIRTSWDFSKPDERVWTPNGFTALTYDGGVLRTVATGDDPNVSALWAEIDAAKFKTLEIKMKTDKPSDGQLFFTGKQGGLNEDKSVKFRLIPDGQFHNYTVDMAANASWKGTITSLRFDPTSVSGAKIEIAYISFK